jgi:hypothetical protein
MKKIILITFPAYSFTCYSQRFKKNFCSLFVAILLISTTYTYAANPLLPNKVAKYSALVPLEKPQIASDGSLTFCEGDSVKLSVPKPNPDTLEYQWYVNSTEIIAATENFYYAKETGEYYVEVSTPSGSVEESDRVNILVLPAPQAHSISMSAPASFCVGDSTVLSVPENADYTYQWRLNGGAIGEDINTFTAKHSGAYTVEVSNSYACSVLASNVVEITVNGLPSIPVISTSGPRVFCEGEPVMLSVDYDNSLAYQWLRDEQL